MLSSLWWEVHLVAMNQIPQGHLFFVDITLEQR